MPSKPGQRKRRPLPWDDDQRQVLALIFEGRKSQAKIAQECGVSLRTCEDWIAHPEFQERLKAMREQLLESCDLLGAAYVRKEQRIVALAQMAESARSEYEAHPWLREIRPLPPKSVVRLKIKSADGEEVTEETEPLDAIVNESFNRDAHAAFREAVADIAAELGARKNVTELSGSVDSNVVFYIPQPEQAPEEPDDGSASA